MHTYVRISVGSNSHRYTHTYVRTCAGNTNVYAVYARTFVRRVIDLDSVLSVDEHPWILLEVIVSTSEGVMVKLLVMS